MEIHKPNPVHSLKEFLNEIAIIIVGVLIALGLEQVVAQWHWRNEVAEAREALREEIAYNLRRFQFNVDNSACTIRNLETLKGLIRNRNTAAIKAAMSDGPYGQLGLAQFAIGTSTWETVNSSAMMAHMPSGERLEFAGLYGNFYNDRIFRLQNANSVLELFNKSENFDGSPEMTRELIETAGAIQLFYRLRAQGQYQGTIAQVYQRLKIKPTSTDPFRKSSVCHPLQADGTFK